MGHEAKYHIKKGGKSTFNLTPMRKVNNLVFDIDPKKTSVLSYLGLVMPVCVYLYFGLLFVCCIQL